MDKSTTDVEPVTVSDILGLDTWNRERSSEELKGFINSKHALLPSDVDLI